MFSSYEWMIGTRYTRAKRGARRNRFISFISAIAMGGIALGIFALIVVLSVMNGFQKDVRDRMLSVLAHIEISNVGDTPLDAAATIEQARRNAHVIGAAPFVAGQGMFARGDSFSGAVIRGIDPAQEDQVTDLGKQMKGGRLQDLVAGEFGVVLGRDLAFSMGVRLGDRVVLVVPRGSVKPAGVIPTLRQLTVVGVFESGHYEYDSSLALVNIDDAQKLFRIDGPSGVRLRVDDMQRAPEIAAQLSKDMSGNLLIRDWSRQNRTWFAAVQIEKRMMFIILTLIVAVAAFNLVSTLVMTVTDKQSDIAILRTLGSSPGSIMKIFVIQGALVGMTGAFIGILAGTLVAYNIDVIVPALEAVLHTKFLPREVYFISTMPSDPRIDDIVTIGVISIVLSLLATLYPSWSASRVRPAEALRYE
ncbi:lipoprotein-releasing ABC transporter permease subunit [soil metagenome]